MIISKNAKWEYNRMHGGVTVYRRVKGTGTAEGMWWALSLHMSTTYDTLKACITDINRSNLLHYGTENP